MPKYIIERIIPNAGELSEADLQAISHKSCGVVTALGPAIQWVHSFVTDDRIYCTYIAANEDLIREQAKERADHPALVERYLGIGRCYRKTGRSPANLDRAEADAGHVEGPAVLHQR